MEMDTGIWNDMREVLEMASILRLAQPFEWSLFNDMCERYAPRNVNSISDLPFKGQ